MRREITNWLRQAEADLKKAVVLFDSNHFDGVAFFSHPAVEKALKALHLHMHQEGVKSHGLVHLATTLNVPRELFSGIRDLNPEYIISRYPDAASGIPAENYDATIVTRHLETAERVITWVTDQMSESRPSRDD